MGTYIVTQIHVVNGASTDPKVQLCVETARTEKNLALLWIRQCQGILIMCTNIYLYIITPVIIRLTNRNEPTPANSSIVHLIKQKIQ